MRFIDDLIGFATEVVLPFAVIAGVVLVGLNAYCSYQCDNYSEITGKKTRFAKFDQCYVETKDGWQRWDEYKARAVASEGLRNE